MSEEHATTNLGAAITAAAKLSEARARRTGAASIVRDYMRQHPDKVVTAAEMQIILANRNPGIVPNAAANALYAAWQRGEIDRSGKEFWLAGKKKRKYSKRKPANGAEPAVATAQVSTKGVSAPTGDADFDADMATLDSALVALARIETVVRRHRELLSQLAPLKRAFAALSEG